MAIQFQQDYRLLELKPVDTWEQANENYRRLVNQWHPDRYSHRPDELAHAQNQFIELTKAFNNLRNFYRDNNRMPFEKIERSVVDSPEPPEHQKIRTQDDEVLESSILNKRKPSAKPLKSGFWKQFAWIGPSCAAIVAGVAIFFIIDRNAKLKRIEEARQVLRTVQPSEYMADVEKINKAQRRADMVNGSDTAGKMGDKLTKDLFN